MTDSTPTSAPRMRASRIASRNSASSAASIVICVKNTISAGSCASRSISSKRSRAKRRQLVERARVGAPARAIVEIGLGHGIEVVVREQDEPEAATPQLDDLADDRIDASAGAASARRCARRNRRSSASGSRERSGPTPTCILSGGSRSQRAGRNDDPVHASAVVDGLQRARCAVGEHRGPDEVAVALHHRVRSAVFVRFLRDTGVAWMPPKTTVRPTCAGEPAHRVAAQGIRRMNADADDVARADGVRVERLECLIHDRRRSVAVRCGGGEHVQPPWGDDGRAEREVAGVDEMYAHEVSGRNRTSRRWTCPGG